jgi:hypothetical protein
MASVLETIEELTRTPGPILLAGRRGTGKDLFARFIHGLLHRQGFFQVSCGQNDDDLKKSLLGYFDDLRAEIAFNPEEEAYEPGILEQASGGTVYLDRIDLAPRGCIHLLLDLLMGKPYKPLGMDWILKEQSSIQFVASCEPHPFDRPECYLSPSLRSVFSRRIVLLPTLQDRRDDIPDLLKLFAEEIASGISIGFHDDFLQTLNRYDWPGNLQELRNVTSQILIRLPTGGTVTGDVVQDILQGLSTRPSEPSEYGRRKRCGVLVKGIVYRNQPVDGEKAYAWISQFAPYRGPHSIDPRDVAEELLRAICIRYFYDGERLRDILEKLFNEFLDNVQRNPYWSRVCQAQAVSAAEALRPHIVVSNPLGPMKSPGFVHLIFRSVSGLTPKRNAVEFGELSNRIRCAKDGLIVVLVDDFIGSGKQFERGVLKRILSDHRLCQAIRSRKDIPVNFFILVCVAHFEGLKRAIEALRAAPSWLDMLITAGDILGPESKTFDLHSSVFQNESIRNQAKDIVVEQIGRILYPDAPQGWGNLQCLVVFTHNTPNDTLPVVWKDGFVGDQLWRAIFPRMGTY